MKAMLLAAGRGSRLQPLTDTTPKPLLTAGQHSLIEHNILSLYKAGIREIIINICHHAKQIIDCLGDGSRYGVQLTYSFEPNEPLGTGGGIYQALALLGESPFILVSADIWSAYIYEPLLRYTMRENCDAHLIFVENPYYHTEGDYALAQDTVTLSGNKLTYANIAKLHPRLFANYQSGVFALGPLLRDAVERGAVSGELFKGPWFNVGTVQELQRLREFLVNWA